MTQSILYMFCMSQLFVISVNFSIFHVHLCSHMYLLCLSLPFYFQSHVSSIFPQRLFFISSVLSFPLLLCMLLNNFLCVFISSVCLSVSFVLKDIASFCCRALETQYKNVNVQKEQKGRAELVIPRYHELVPRQEDKKVSVCVYVGGCPCHVILYIHVWIDNKSFKGVGSMQSGTLRGIGVKVSC